MSVANQIMENNPLMSVMGLVVVLASVVTFGLVDVQVLNETIAPYAGWIFVGGFVSVYILSDRSIGELEDFELVSFLVPVLAVVSFKVFPEVQNLVAEYNPYGALVLLGVTVSGYYALSTNMRLSAVAMQLAVGSVLVITASVQFGLMDVSVMGTDITSVSVWVFLIALALAYFISEHTIGRMNKWEIGAVVVGASSYVAYTYAPSFKSFVDANNPATGITLTFVVILAYWFVMHNGKLR